MKKFVGFLIVLMCVGLAHGAILQDMGDSGQFSRSALVYSPEPGSYWSYHTTSNASVTLVNDGGTAPSNYLDANVGWYPRTAHAWYVDASASGTTDHWSVSADVSATLGRDNGYRMMRLGTSTGVGTFAPWAFEMNLRYHTNTIDWVAGNKSGSTSVAGMSTAWTNVEFTYNAATGAAIGTFGSVEVFNEIIDTGLTINAVSFLRQAPGGVYDNGSLNVDNVAAEIVPEPLTMSLLSLGGLVALRRRNR